MNDQNDEIQNYALMVLAGIVGLVIAGVISLAAHTALGRSASGAAAATAARQTSGVSPAAGAPEGRVYFVLGSDALPAEASEVLVRVADAARQQPGRVVLISGFHDASGDAASNAELAKKRALAVRHALEANGVEPERLVMDKPLLATGGDGARDARDARRVEMRLR